MTKIDDYTRWLEVALRAQVVCNSEFSKRYDEIQRFILTKANGFIHSEACTASMRENFLRLEDMMEAVAIKYNVDDLNYLREHFGSDCCS